MTNLVEDMVTVGQIERAFGVKGEVKVRSLSDIPGRLEKLTRVSLVSKSGAVLSTSVTHVRRAGTAFIIGLANVRTPEAVGPWRGGLIQAPRGTAHELPEGQYYECDLLGLLVQTQQGQLIGEIEQIWELPGSHVFVVRQGTQELLIPAVREWVQAVDLEARVMTVCLIDGMGDEK